MKKEQLDCPKFNLQNGEHPQVLLFGNGLYRSFDGNSWADLLKKLCKNKDLMNLNLEDDLNSPMTLRAQLITNRDVKQALATADKNLYGSLENAKLKAMLQSILSIGFTDIITTNYDYRLEMAAADKSYVTDYYLDKHAHNTLGKRVENKYSIHSFQSAEYSGAKNRIWHIHGEAKKQDSILLSLYYYLTFTNRVINYLKDTVQNKYLMHQLSGEPKAIRSWVDSFILGDVYVLGFGFDYAESDLWWLLQRKHSENAETGKVYFYEPKNMKCDKKELYSLLTLFGAEIIDLGVVIPEEITDVEKPALYLSFYEKAIKDIEEKYKKNSGGKYENNK